MKQSHFIYLVEAAIMITKQEVEQIKAVAAQHCDGKCQEFGRKTLTHWLMMFEDTAPGAGISLTVTWSELDAVAKILECERYVEGVHLYDAWVATFQALREESERINAHHVMNDPFYLQRHREELRRKYGDGTVTIPAPPKLQGSPGGLGQEQSPSPAPTPG
jgi:hypothetical protein